MKKLLFVGLILSAAFSTLVAQKLTSNTYQIGLGGSFFNFKELNDAYTLLNNKSLNGTMTNVGFSYGHIHNRFMFGIDGSYTTKVASRAFNNSNQFDSYNQFMGGMFKVGYSPVVWDDTYFFYPTVGVGGGMGTLRRIDKLDSVGGYPILNYKVGGVLLEGALNMTIITPMPDSDDTNAVLGVSVGYHFAPLWGDMWKINTLVSNKGIPMRPQGIFFRVSMGLGYGR